MQVSFGGGLYDCGLSTVALLLFTDTMLLAFTKDGRIALSEKCVSVWWYNCMVQSLGDAPVAVMLSCQSPATGQCALHTYPHDLLLQFLLLLSLYFVGFRSLSHSMRVDRVRTGSLWGNPDDQLGACLFLNNTDTGCRTVRASSTHDGVLAAAALPADLKTVGRCTFSAASAQSELCGCALVLAAQAWDTLHPAPSMTSLHGDSTL